MEVSPPPHYTPISLILPQLYLREIPLINLAPELIISLDLNHLPTLRRYLSLQFIDLAVQGADLIVSPEEFVENTDQEEYQEQDSEEDLKPVGGLEWGELELEGLGEVAGVVEGGLGGEVVEALFGDTVVGDVDGEGFAGGATFDLGVSSLELIDGEEVLADKQVLVLLDGYYLIPLHRLMRPTLLLDQPRIHISRVDLQASR